MEEVDCYRGQKKLLMMNEEMFSTPNILPSINPRFRMDFLLSPFAKGSDEEMSSCFIDDIIETQSLPDVDHVTEETPSSSIKLGIRRCYSQEALSAATNHTFRIAPTNFPSRWSPGNVTLASIEREDQSFPGAPKLRRILKQESQRHQFREEENMPLQTIMRRQGPLAEKHMKRKNPSIKRKSNQDLRKGKWSREEECFAAAIVRYFLSGHLPIPHGITLRTYLATQLKCDPMRVSKKLVVGGKLADMFIDHRVGKKVYKPTTPNPTNETIQAVQEAKTHLDSLRAKFFERMREEDQLRINGDKLSSYTAFR